MFLKKTSSPRRKLTKSKSDTLGITFLIYLIIIIVLVSDSSIRIFPVKKIHINAKNVYVIVPPSIPPKQTNTNDEKGFNENSNFTFHEDSAEIGRKNCYHFVKRHQNKENDYHQNLRSSFETNKIVGGVEVDINMYPYHVAYGSNCGGAIIHEKWVMTAAHCGLVRCINGI